HGRPFCTLKAALSVEGHLAPPPAERKATLPHWLTGPESRAEVQRMRHGSDALITGIGTVLADDPALTDRTGKPRRRPLLRVVLDSELRISLSSQLVRSAQGDVLVVCGELARGGAELEAAGAEVLRVPSVAGRLDLAAVLEELARRQILSVLVEAGSRVNGAFLGAGLIQKAVLFYSETELGEGAVPFAEGVGSPFLLEQHLRRVRRRLFGTDACVSGYLEDPWGA
ncbi:MAG TPA: RibD family protein, partial [Granulicella sp.]